VLACAGCSGSTPPAPAMTDAGGPVGVTVAPPLIDWLDPAAPELAAPPIAPPALAPCPTGWRESTTDTGIVVCEPWPEGGPAVCPEGEAQFPGDSACAPIGDPCPADTFPAGLPTDRTIVYVLAGALSGDGTRGRPFGTVGEALASAPTGAVVAIGAGTYDEPLTITRDVTLWGECATRTILTAPAPTTTGTPTGVILVTSGSATVRNLRLANAGRTGISVGGAAASLELDGVVLSRVSTQGLTVWDGATVAAHDVVIRDTQPRARDGLAGNGIGVESATVTLARVLVERNRYMGILIGAAGASLDATDLVVRDTQPMMTDASAGGAIAAIAGAHVRLTRSVLERNRMIGVLCDGATVEIESSVVRDVLSQEADRAAGRGIGVQQAGVVTARRLLVERTRELGLYAGGGGVTLVAQDVVVRDVESREVDGASGRGVNAERGATVELARAVVERTRDVGITSHAATVHAEDVIVRDTRPPEADALAGGFGAHVQEAGVLTLTRARIDRSNVYAVSAVDADTQLSLEDVLVTETTSNPDGEGIGIGVFAQLDASASLSRVVIDGAEGMGIAGDSGALIRIADAVVRGGRSIAGIGSLGRAFGVQLGARAEVARARFSSNRDVAVLAFGEGSAIDMEDVTIEDTMPRECASTTCASEPFGIGIGSYWSASVTARRFEIARADLCGVHIAGGGQLDLHEGAVTGAAIGACVESADYDVSRLTDGVAYYDNGTNLQASELPVPEPTEWDPTTRE